MGVPAPGHPLGVRFGYGISRHAVRRIAGIRRFYVVSHDWGSVIGSVLVGDHPDRILGFVRMELDLTSPKTLGDWLAFYRVKPQWLVCQSYLIGRYAMQDPGWLVNFAYSPRMTTPLRPVDRNYLVYEFSRPGVAEMVPNYFLPRNWDLPAATDKICANRFPFPVLQLQATADPDQPMWLFQGVATRCPNVKMEWVTGASHFDNFDRPEEVAEAINRFVHATRAAGRASSSGF